MIGIDIADAIRKSLIQLVKELEHRDLEKQLEILKTVGEKNDLHELSRLIDEEHREVITSIVLDASVYAPLIVSCGKALPRVSKEIKAAILDLTLYEVCNAFWKEHVELGKINREEVMLACRISRELSRYLILYRIDDLDSEHIMDIAIENGLTFYDASYIALAVKLRASIASEDSDILRVAPRYRIEILGLDQLLKLCSERSSLP